MMCSVMEDSRRYHCILLYHLFDALHCTRSGMALGGIVLLWMGIKVQTSRRIDMGWVLCIGWLSKIIETWQGWTYWTWRGFIEAGCPNDPKRRCHGKAKSIMTRGEGFFDRSHLITIYIIIVTIILQYHHHLDPYSFLLRYFLRQHRSAFCQEERQ